MTDGSKCKTDTNKYFLGEFQLEGDRISFKKVLNFTLPEINYEVGYQMIDCDFYKNYCLTMLSNNLYDLEKGSIVKMNIPHNKKFNIREVMKGTETAIYNLKHFVVKDGFVYLMITDENKMEERFLKYDLSNKKIEKSVVVPMFSHYPFLDIVDPNYVFIPFDKNTIIRRKIL